jgi:hypothetical protein
MQSAATKARYRFRTPDAICVAVLIGYFLHFALPARHGGFREDEMMNSGRTGISARFNHSWGWPSFGHHIIGREARFTICRFIIFSA